MGFPQSLSRLEHVIPLPIRTWIAILVVVGIIDRDMEYNDEACLFLCFVSYPSKTDDRLYVSSVFWIGADRKVDNGFCYKQIYCLFVIRSPP